MKKLCLALLCVGIGGALLFVLLKNGNPTPVVPQYEETSQPPRDFLCEIPEGKLALSISIPGFAEGFSGKLLPGDLVSVFAPDDVLGGMAVPLALTYLEVITTTTSGGVDCENVTEKDDGTRPLPASITLLVNEKQAALLAELERSGKLHVAFVCRAEDPHRAEYLAKQEEWLKYGDFMPLSPEKEDESPALGDLALRDFTFPKGERGL